MCLTPKDEGFFCERPVISRNVIDIAKYILKIKGSMPWLKLNMICFAAQEAMMMHKGHPGGLFDEDFYAYADAPVCKELLFACRKTLEYNLSYDNFPGNCDSLPEEHKLFLESIVARYEFNIMDGKELADIAKTMSVYREARKAMQNPFTNKPSDGRITKHDIYKNIF